jgi:signal transduction histidine kinase/CheY-like chemotaxis protein
MNRPAYIYREKRLYNKWAASQTLEDYALRYTADHARIWSAGRVANTAAGAAAFLACEAIGATITLAYGFSNSVAAIAAAVVLMFVIGFPIAYHSAKQGLDIDLLTRGAGFGYLGSTITSLIYASFTFLLFSVEASIMAVALAAMFHIPMSLAYVASSLVVIPIALYGMSVITRFQAITQPVWVLIQLAPIAYILWLGQPALEQWSSFTGQFGLHDGSVSLLYFGLAFSTLLSLLPQIGEQADYLRFLPSQARTGAKRWWLSLIVSGPGWTLIGGTKLLLGSFLADYALRHAVVPANAASPTDLFLTIFTSMTSRPGLALAITGIFVIVCQLKINVTNAYAGSIAWSNFFARLTHSHPGRVVWLIFNVLLSLLLMEVGILGAIEGILILYANAAAGWIGALAADLMVSKPLGLSPKGIEFKRAHLYDINPVGVGAMALSLAASTVSHIGLLGALMQAFAPAIGLAVAFVAAPAIALATRGRYYLARASSLPADGEPLSCVICENDFQPHDMAHCPVYAAPICSLCCTLEARCHDRCKENSRAAEQVAHWLERLLPDRIARYVHTPVGHFIGVMSLITLCNALVLNIVYSEYVGRYPGTGAVIGPVLLGVFFIFFVLAGIAAWIIVLAHESRRGAMKETQYHLQMLVEEIAAHEVTDSQLQKAKEAAELANAAKSRYLVNVSHEIRSPLNSIYGYAQLLERGSDVSPVEAAKVIRRSSEHLTNLVEGLLDISQVESGVLRISRDTVRLPSFLDQLANMFRPQAHAKGINFVFERPERLPEFVHTDQKRLRQILINVLSNAIKFTERGEVAFRIKYRSQLATFEISDTGIGIDPKDIKKIFDPFERGSNPNVQRQQGVGLGLSITHALVQILGGEIKIRSEPGKGASFTIRLMLSQAAGSAVPEGASGDAVSGYAGNRRSVLLIDDDPTQISVLRNLLEPIGFTVYTALDGESGLVLAGQTHPDLVLLDITMPGISGWETARRLREAHGTAVRIVMVSADAHEFRRGGDGYEAHDMFLMKPVELNTLLDTIADQLSLEWSGSGPVASISDGRVAAASPPLAAEARPFVAALEQLVRIGHVRGIEGKIREMESAVPDTAPFARDLLALLDRFDLKGLGTLLKTRQDDGR